jgi:hypothetical protein
MASELFPGDGYQHATTETAHESDGDDDKGVFEKILYQL